MSALEIALLLDTLGGLVLSMLIWVIYHRLMAMENAASELRAVPANSPDDARASFQRNRAA